jgi:uncharacterized protein YbcC (UPF0753/DUF2309 family)
MYIFYETIFFLSRKAELFAPKHVKAVHIQIHTNFHKNKMYFKVKNCEVIKESKLNIALKTHVSYQKEVEICKNSP